MRIAAGVLLIITAIFNGCGAVGYLGLGGAAAVVGEAADKSSKPVEGEALTAEQVEQAAQTSKAAQEAKTTGGLLMVMGLFLAVMFGLQIAGGVVLFMRKAATFALVVGTLGIIAEVLGIVITTAGITNIFGIVASVLAIVAALALKKTGEPAPA